MTLLQGTVFGLGSLLASYAAGAVRPGWFVLGMLLVALAGFWWPQRRRCHCYECSLGASCEDSLE